MKLRRRLTFYAWQPSSRAGQPFDPHMAQRAIAATDPHRDAIPLGDFRVAASCDEDLVASADPVPFLLHRLRDHNQRPLVSSPTRRPEPVSIAADESLLDIAHVLVWPDGYAAIDQGGHAPTLAVLSRYLSQVCDIRVVFLSLFNRDLLQRVQALRSIKSVDIRIQNSSNSQHVANRADTPLRSMLRALRGVEEIHIGVSVSAPTRGRGSRKRFLPAELAQSFVDEAAHATEDYSRFIIRGRNPDGQSETINLLNERLHIEESLPRIEGGGAAPESEAVFDALRRAREALDADGRLRDAARQLPNDTSQ